MEERVKQNLIRLGVKAGDTVGAAVSGGMDSMALLYCLCNMRESLNILIIAYHMEHGIRGESSKSDMDFVIKQCEAWGVKCVAGRADVPAIAKEKGVSIETAARQARYGFLERADARFMATAHHMEDNAETVIMNLVRGSGTAGLCGIPEKRGKFIRPMLGISKSEIERYVKAHGIEYVDDETNDDTGYTRNFIRKEIIPRLRRINEAASANISRAAGILAEDEKALRAIAKGLGCIEYTEESAMIDLGIFERQQTAVKKRIIRLAAQNTAGLEDLEYVNMQGILELAERRISAKRIDLALGMYAGISYGKLIIGKHEEKKYNKKSVALMVGTVCFDGIRFECSRFEGTPKYGRNAEYFSADAVAGAVFRHRREGDFIVPLGMQGTKRLSDYLSDRKVPLIKRDSLIVLAKGSEVFWVAGAGVSETSKVRDGSEIYRIRFEGIGDA
jgi:tRNA(Ile)-lysidine synthase